MRRKAPGSADPQARARSVTEATAALPEPGFSPWVWLPSTPVESSNAEMRRTDVLRDSPRMFENDLLDKLSRVHPVVPVLLFVPAVVVFVVLAATHDLGVFSIIAWALGGYAFW